jgi:NADH-quinone oxidoreductase subunit L
MIALIDHLAPISTVLASQDASFPIAHAVEGGAWAGWILWLPLISMALCGLCWLFGIKSKLPAWITVVCLGVSFLLTVLLYLGYDQPVTIQLFDWFDLEWGSSSGAAFLAPFALYVDTLTLFWMLFVTGLGTLIAFYASEYMEPDVGRGYARFFAGISVFLFAMGALVMGDNLVMLYLGWEGVGFASYWLIGYYYQKPSAVAAAKKAFIMNRIGDVGLALAIYLIYHYFGTVQYAELFTVLSGTTGEQTAGGWPLKAIPFLLMLGAFGKSAQIPLYVWLPDAMEGPTPVSALIHAATMVTAGVYLLCRLFPVMQLNAYALPTVAWIGGLTALLAATIAVAQYDIKRIMAYSTISQLGYMFLGIGLMTTLGAASHVFMHAFFKAVLFLTCGAIMHGFAGQLDLRKLSGLRYKRGWQITCWTMFYACLCLVGFPIITNGFYSKDSIIAEAFIVSGPGFRVLGVIALFTALLTAYYAFRVWFRVFTGPIYYEMGDDHHGDVHQPHPPRFAINFTLLAISAGAIWSIYLGRSWDDVMIEGSSAAGGVPHEHGEAHVGFWSDPHRWVTYVAGAVSILGVAVAWYLHLANRKLADDMRASLLGNAYTRWLPTAMENKWYVDEIYQGLIRAPLWMIGHVLNLFDRYIVDGLLVDGIARIPRAVGKSFQPLHNGILQSYAISMIGGAALVALLVLFMPRLSELLSAYFGGGGG